MKIFTLISFPVILLLLNLFSATCFAQSQWAFLAYSGNPVLQGDSGQWDSAITFTPSVVYHNDTLHLFYTGGMSLALPTAIGLATSTDNYVFTKSIDNPIFQPDGSGFDAYGISDPVICQDGTDWLMYYGGKSSASPGPGDYIGRATATALEGPWDRDPQNDPVLSVGTSGEWDDGFVLPNTVLEVDTGYIMYYSGSNLEWPNGYWQVGLAISDDGISWNKYNDPITPGNSDPVLRVGPTGSWDSHVACFCCVLPTTNGYEMFYNGDNNITYGIGYATSSDGIHWTKDSLNPIFTKQDDPYVATNPDAGLESPAVFVQNGRYFMYYDYGPNVGTIGLATSVVNMIPRGMSEISRSFELFQNYPNPFNPSTTISWQLTVSSPVKLNLYNLVGQRVITLVDEWLAAGKYSINFDASELASGVYLYRLEAGNFTDVRKMIIMK